MSPVRPVFRRILPIAAPPLLAAALVLGLAPAWAGGGAGKTPPDLKRAAKGVSTKLLKKHLFHLASDQLEGREAGTRGGHAAAVYIAEQYEAAGLEPAGTEGFFQPFGPAGERGEVADANHIRVSRSKRGSSHDEFAYGEDFRPARFSATGRVVGPAVFGGYGISAPEIGYDDYETLDPEGCVVLVLDHEPQETLATSPFAGAELTGHAAIRRKAETAAAKGAVALLVVRDAVAHPDADAFPASDELVWPPAGEVEALAIPVAYVSEKLAAAILRPARKRLDKLQTEIDQTLKTTADALKEYDVVVKVAAEGPVVGGKKNVVALKRGSDPKLRDEYVVISAHYDHVGYGTAQNSRGGVGQIHNGADDNASGTSGLIELARALEKLELRRSVLLMSFDAEEKGLVGSRHYASAPTVPMDQIVTILNMDMISRNKPDEIFVGGMGRNATLDRVIGEISARYKLSLNPQGMEQYLRRSDQWSFMEKGVPGLFFYGGNHGDYHTANDDPEKSDLIKVKLITQVCIVFLYDIANADESPRAVSR